MTDDERNDFHCRGNVNQSGFVCQIVSPGEVPNYDRVPLQYSGFCPVALVSGQGFLLPGNNRIGLLLYEDKFYACSTLDRAEEFGRNPTLFISAIDKVVTDQPCLLRILAVEEDEEPTMQMSDITKESQTPTHMIPENRNNSYRWNEWDMRREALKLADLNGKTTHSAQTMESSMRRSVSTQNISTRDSMTQTNVDTSTEIPQARSVVVGLRGNSNLPVQHMLLDDFFANNCS